MIYNVDLNVGIGMATTRAAVLPLQDVVLTHIRSKLVIAANLLKHSFNSFSSFNSSNLPERSFPRPPQRVVESVGLSIEWFRRVVALGIYCRFYRGVASAVWHLGHLLLDNVAWTLPILNLQPLGKNSQESIS